MAHVIVKVSKLLGNIHVQCECGREFDSVESHRYHFRAQAGQVPFRLRTKELLRNEKYFDRPEDDSVA